MPQTTADATPIRIEKALIGLEKTTVVRITPEVEVATIDGWIHVWAPGKHVKIGPLTPEQAERLGEDLGYDAVG